MSLNVKNETIRIENGYLDNRNGNPLVNLYFYAYQGEQTGIFCNNIINTNTILNILSGQQSLQSGSIYINENNVQNIDANPQSALKELTAIISETPKFSSNLSVAENFAILSPKKHLLLNKYHYIHQLQTLLSQFDIPFDFQTPLSELSPLQRCIGELFQAFSFGKKLIIIHNPSSFLSNTELQNLTGLINRLAVFGICFLIFDLSIDFLTYCSSTIFLVNNGATAAKFSRDEFDEIYKYFDIASAELKEPHYSGICSAAAPVLKFSHVSFKSINDISFSLSPGQCALIKCSKYSEYKSLCSLLTEPNIPENGKIYFKNKPFISKGICANIQNGLSVLPEIAYESILNEKLDAVSNCTFNILPKIKNPFFSNKYYFSVYSRLSEFFSDEDLHRPVSTFSPVEKEKLVLCKMLLQSPNVLVCLHPFFCTSYKMENEVKKMLLEYSANNIALLIITLHHQVLPVNTYTEYTIKNGSLSKINSTALS